MSQSINKVILIGNLGRDPEIKTTDNSQKIANLSVATSESWKDKSTGERKDRTEWHKVVIFNEHLIDVAERYLRKGSKLYIEGQLQTRKWQDKDGQDKYSTEVVLSKFKGEITMLDGKTDSNQSTSQEYNDITFSGHSEGKLSHESAYRKASSLNDDVPF